MGAAGSPAGFGAGPGSSRLGMGGQAPGSAPGGVGGAQAGIPEAVVGGVRLGQEDVEILLAAGIDVFSIVDGGNPPK